MRRRSGDGYEAEAIAFGTQQRDYFVSRQEAAWDRVFLDMAEALTHLLQRGSIASTSQTFAPLRLAA